MTEPTSTKVKVSTLTLVYPPMSNQETVWMQSNEAAEAILRQSDFYMIDGRAEARFENFQPIPNDVLTFDFKVGDTFSDSGANCIWNSATRSFASATAPSASTARRS